MALKGEVDALVIGAGVAGLTAAEMIGECGFQTLVVASGYGCSQASSGTVDVLGHYGNKPVLNLELALEEFVRERTQHIYALAGKEVVLNALSEFQRRSDGLYAGGGGRNLEVITPLGESKNTYLVQFTMLNTSFEALSRGKVILVAVPGLPGYAPHIIAERMREKGVDVKLAKLDLTATSPFQLADNVESHPDILTKKLREAGAGDHEWVVLPPVLGLRRVRETQQVVEEALGSRILELPSFPPSVPGKRLYLSLKNRCERVGVEVVLGELVSKVRIEKGKVREVLTNKGSYAPSVLVLSTGWVLSQILKIRGLSSREDRYERGSIKAGEVENLFFARSSVSHEEKIGLGAAITAGHLAGKAALDYLRGEK